MSLYVLWNAFELLVLPSCEVEPEVLAAEVSQEVTDGLLRNAKLLPDLRLPLHYLREVSETAVALGHDQFLLIESELAVHTLDWWLLCDVYLLWLLWKV